MMLSPADAAIEAAKIKRRALREVGDLGADCAWDVALPMATSGGTWTLSFAGQTTVPLSALAMPGEVQSGLDGLLGAGNFAVTGVPRGPYRIKLTGALGAQELEQTIYPLGANGDLLDPPATIVPVQIEAGEAPILAAIATEIYDDDLAQIANPETRFLHLKIALIDTLLGTSQKGVDVQTAQRMERLSQQHEHLLEMRALAQHALNLILGKSSTFDQATTTVTGVITKKTPNGLPYGVLGRRGVL